MALDVRCDVCGTRVEPGADKAGEWWMIRAWQRAERDLYGRPGLGASADEVEKDICPKCMVEVAQAMGRR